MKRLFPLILFCFTLEAGAENLLFAPVQEISHELPPVAGMDLTGTLIQASGSVEVFGSPSGVRDSSGNLYLVHIDRVGKTDLALRFLRQRGNTWEGALVNGNR